MPAHRKETKWWIAAVLLPFICLGIGLLLAFAAPKNENDWIGASILLPIYFGLLAGCILSSVLAIVSLVNRETGSFYAVLVGLPALIFVIYSAFDLVEGRRQAKIQTAYRIESLKAQDAEHLFHQKCREELRANPALITDDKFWIDHQRPDKAYEIGLLNLLADPSFEPTPDIVEYVMKHVTYSTNGLFATDRLSRAQLETIADGSDYPEDSRRTAADMIRAGKYKKASNSSTSAR